MKHYPLYYLGDWQDRGETISVVNPATGEVFATTASVNQEELGGIIHFAHQSFKEWSSLTGLERGDSLYSIASAIEGKKENLARTITMENGKPLEQSTAEVNLTIDHFRWFAEESRRGYGRIVPPQAEGKRHLIIKKPVGVVGAITPWNFPLMLAARKAAPALAAGCPVILKPAGETPLCVIELARCVEEAGLPAGVFQVIAGNAADIGNEMLQNPLCRKITFTGSTAVGKKLIAGASATCTRLSLELGGNAPLIIFSDADFDRAVEGAIITKFRNGGQSCIASNRIYVQEPVYERFLESFIKRVRALKVGNGIDAGVDVGPMINEKSLTGTLAMIEDAVSKGARLLAGGKRLPGEGFFLEPAVLADVPATAACSREEIFAPVAALYPFKTEEDAVAMANDTEYGLAAYAFTENLGRALRLAEKLEAGTVGINDPVPATSICPFGGFKQSGWGRELGVEGMEAFLETTHASIGNV